MTTGISVGSPITGFQWWLYAITFFSLAWWAMIAHNDTARKQQTQYGDNDKYSFHKRSLEFL